MIYRIITDRSTYELTQLHGIVGCRTELIRRMRRRGFTVQSWPSGAFGVYFSRSDARRDDTGERAIATIDSVDQYGHALGADGRPVGYGE